MPVWTVTAKSHFTPVWFVWLLNSRWSLCGMNSTNWEQKWLLQRLAEGCSQLTRSSRSFQTNSDLCLSSLWCCGREAKRKTPYLLKPQQMLHAVSRKSKGAVKNIGHWLIRVLMYVGETVRDGSAGGLHANHGLHSCRRQEVPVRIPHFKLGRRRESWPNISTQASLL